MKKYELFPFFEILPQNTLNLEECAYKKKEPFFILQLQRLFHGILISWHISYTRYSYLDIIYHQAKILGAPCSYLVQGFDSVK